MYTYIGRTGSRWQCLDRLIWVCTVRTHSCQEISIGCHGADIGEQHTVPMGDVAKRLRDLASCLHAMADRLQDSGAGLGQPALYTGDLVSAVDALAVPMGRLVDQETK